jgi:hypothetical protein
LIAFAGTALADNFTGQSSAGGYVRVKTNEFNKPELFVIRWRADCDAGSLVYRAKNAFAGPYRHQSRNGFVDWNRHRNNNVGDGYSSVVTAQYKGARVANNRWSGTFQAWVRLKRNGKFVSNCRTGELHWTTTR